MDITGLEFRFSGLKTFALNTVQNEGSDEQTKADIALAFEVAVAETMAIKCRRALQETGLKRLIIAGGVSANQRLRHHLHAMAKKEQAELYYPRLEFCTDNAAMIAFAGCQRLLNQHIHEALSLDATARWDLASL